MFEGVFKVQAENFNLYLSKPNYLEELLTQNGAVGDAVRGAPSPASQVGSTAR